MNIREANEQDFEAIWPFFSEIVSAGETYPYPVDTSKAEGLELWIHQPHKTYVLEENGEILGSYYIKPNQPGLGSHICNCGYMVSPKAQGKGLAKQLCEHSQQTAKQLGYRAMQFNLVVSTNIASIKVWPKLGFEIVGRVPQAFSHPIHGYVDAFIMYKLL